MSKAAIDGLMETVKMEPEVERTTPPASRKFVHDTRGRAIYMLAGLLEQQPKIDYAQIGPLLKDFETNYPGMSDRFQDVEEWRITALDAQGNYDEVERDVKSLVEKNKNNMAANDFIKGLGLDFWKQAQTVQNTDQKRYLENAKLTAIAYSYFSDMVAAGKIPVKNLTGTLSILGQAEIALGDVGKAETIFNEVVKADPGLARCQRRIGAHRAGAQGLEERGDDVDQRREHRGRVRQPVVRGQVPACGGLPRAGQHDRIVQQARVDARRASQPRHSGDEGAVGFAAAQAVPGPHPIGAMRSRC